MTGSLLLTLQLFDKTISCTLASQTSMAAAMSDFLVSKWRESYLAHVSLPISASKKRELLVSPGSGLSLFDQDLLEKVSGQVKEDTFISSSLSLAKLASDKCGGKGKASSSSGSSQGVSSSRYPSPLEFPRVGSSGYSKQSASPARGGGGKRGRGGRGVSPSPGSRKGFRKWEPCSCPLIIGGCLSLHWQVWRDRHGSLGGGGVTLRVSASLSLSSSPVQGTHPFFDLYPFIH